jgi:iron(III) transport system permease protein
MLLRIVAAIGLGLLLGLPLLQPFAGLRDARVWEWEPDDVERVARLLANTLLLVGATCLAAVPAGTLLAVLLFRANIPGRRLLLVLLVLFLFVPLPVIVSSWQSSLGAGGLLPSAVWMGGGDRPWATGWGPAIWVHAVAAMPWVVCIVGLGLRWVEPELEEEAALQLPAWRVLWHVTLPGCRVSILAAALFVGLQTANEISVTDMMLVSTLAEEVYTQFTLGEAALPRTLALSLPGLLLLVAMLSVGAARLERSLPPLPSLLRSPGLPSRRPAWLGLLIVVLAFAVLIVPAAGLLWKLGEAGPARGWSLTHAWNQLAGEWRLLGGAVVRSLETAVATGVLVSGLALACCWLAAGARWLQMYLLIVLMTAWILPAPVIGIGLKELTLALPDGPWLGPLYYGPSPLPIVWVHIIRFLPAAVFFLWPVVRVIPRELLDAARLDGAGPLREFVSVVWPMTARAMGVIALAVTALAVGEHEAAGRVATPMWEAYAKLLFDRMHYGADSNVAALSLLLLGALTAAALLSAGLWRGWRAISSRRR